VSTKATASNCAGAGWRPLHGRLLEYCIESKFHVLVVAQNHYPLFVVKFGVAVNFNLESDESTHKWALMLEVEAGNHSKEVIRRANLMAEDKPSIQSSQGEIGCQLFQEAGYSTNP
jgi:hypothetical protein